MDSRRTTETTGVLTIQILRQGALPRPTAESTRAFLRRVLRDGAPSMRLPRPIRHWRVQNFPAMIRGLRRVLLARTLGLPTLYGTLCLEPIFAIGTPDERRVNLGLSSLRVITNNGVGYIVDAFQNLVELENMKFHGLGTGSTTEDPTDAALVTELTTQYTGNVRATGNLAEGATGNIFHTEATNTLDETPGAALREHGVFSASSAGVLFDRSVFAAINLTAGDGLLSRYEVTFASGG